MALVRELRRASPRILHLQHPTRATRFKPAVYLLPLLTRMLARQVSVVTTFHYIRPVGIRTALLRTFFLLPAVFSHAIMVTTEWEAAYVRRLLPWISVVVVPAGLTEPMSRPSAPERVDMRRQLGFEDEDFVVAYFGYLLPNKGIESLIVSLADTPPGVKLLVLGGEYRDDRSYAAALQRLAANAGVAGRVTWTGHVEPTAIPRYLSAGDCAALPFDEGASLKRSTLLAAISVGLPILSTYGPELDPSMRDGETLLLVAPNEPDQMAGAIERLRIDSELRRHLTGGAMRILDLVDWNGIARRHIDLYRSLTQAYGPR